MIGTLLNVAAILTGGTLGLTLAKDLSLRAQTRIKSALGVFTVYVGFSTIWSSMHGSFFSLAGQLGIVMLALVAGNATGKLLRLQKSLNRLGRYAHDRFQAADPSVPNRAGEGFVTCTLLFCVGPMAIIGSLQDGLTGNFKILAIKSAMDGLATMAFAKPFGPGVMLSAIPLLAYQGSITLGAQFVQPYLENKALVDSINATGGFLILTITLLIFEVRKVPVADYLPALLWAPVLTALFR